VTTGAADDVVRTWDERLAREPLLVLEPLERFLDAAGVGSGPVRAAAIGDGHSNVTFALEREGSTVVLRRPPRGPLPPSAHDVLREARLLEALGPAGVRVPEILATCDDESVIGAPFYVMSFVAGHVLTTTLPEQYAPAAIGASLVDALAELHAVDVEAAGLTGFGRTGGYLGRQLRRFRGLLESTATRPLPVLEQVADWLERSMPAEQATRVVHGDYRLGNALFALDEPRVVALLDWELAALGDPLADLGYLTAMWAEPGDDPDNPMRALGSVTRQPGFASRAELAARYADLTGADISALPWYQVLALWKASIFLEGSYKRYLAGSTDDVYFARLGERVPVLADAAWRLTVTVP
jgi:aminoglycoside phosphotransferase (APT) family kinase protein